METEVERLVVRLVGDGSSFQKMMTQATQATSQAATQIAAAGKRMESIRGTLTGLGRDFVGVLGVFGMAQSLRGAFDQFASLERNQLRLRAVLSGTGQDVDGLIERYERFADAMSKSTLQTKGSIFQMLQQASMMGMVGDQAERVVGNAVALASVTGRDAEGLIRATVAMERGNYQMLKRTLGLQGIKDETELVTRINTMLTAGMTAANAEFNSAYGRVERLGRSLKMMGTEIGGVIAKFLLPLVSMLQQAFDAFKKLDQGTKDIVTAVLIFAMLDAAIRPVIITFQRLTGPIIDMTGAIAQNTVAWIYNNAIMIVSTAAWLAWKVVLGLTAVAVFTFAAVYAVLSGQITFGTLGMLAAKLAALAYAAVMLVWKGIVWLLNAALTVMNLLIAPAVILASVAAFAALLVIFGAVYVATMGVVGAISAMWTLIRGINVGPLGQIAEVFREWGRILKEIWTTAQSDMSLAWRMFQAAANLAWEQIKATIPEVWKVVVAGSAAAWMFVKTSFVANMKIGINEIFAYYNGMAPPIMRFNGVAENIAGLERQIEDTSAWTLRQINDAITRFTVPETDGTRAARVAYEGLRPTTDQLNNARQFGGQIGAQMNAGLRAETARFDSVIFGSLDALQRIEEYKSRLTGFSGVSTAAEEAITARRRQEARDREAARATAVLQSVGGNQLISTSATEVLGGLIGLGATSPMMGPLAGSFNATLASQADPIGRDVVNLLTEIRNALAPSGNQSVTVIPVNFDRR